MDDNLRKNYPSEYWQERLSNDFNLGGVGLLGLGKVFNAWLYKIRELAMNRALSKLRLKADSQNILDIGCGTGFWLRYWHKKGAKKITGIDITEVSIKNLRKCFPGVTLHQDDIGRPGLELGERYELVSAIDVLYHITDHRAWVTALENIAKHLTSGGLLLVTDLFLHKGEYRAHHQVSRSLCDYELQLSKLRLKVLGRFPIFVFAHYPHDARGLPRQTLELIWFLQIKSLTLANNFGAGLLWGNLLGSFMFLVEAISTRLCQEGPSLELMVCKKLKAY